MLEVRDLPIQSRETASEFASLAPAPAWNPKAGSDRTRDGMNFEAMETPLVMSGFHPEAIKLWQQQMAGTGLETVAAGGVGGSSSSDLDLKPSAGAQATMVPGSEVSPPRG